MSLIKIWLKFNIWLLENEIRRRQIQIQRWKSEIEQCEKALKDLHIEIATCR